MIIIDKWPRSSVTLDELCREFLANIYNSGQESTVVRLLMGDVSGIIIELVAMMKAQ